MFPISVGLLVLILVVLIPVVGRSAPAPAESVSAGTAFPGGVANAAGKIGFVTNPDSGIDTLDLETGKLLWQTADASKPLATFEKRLVTQAVMKGKKLSENCPNPLFFSGFRGVEWRFRIVSKANSIRILMFDADNGKKLPEGDYACGSSRWRRTSRWARCRMRRVRTA
jgi:hypothetical protein